MISEVTGPYADWLLRPDGSATKSFSLEDQMELSVIICALGHGIREMAYSRMSDEDAARLSSKQTAMSRSEAMTNNWWAR